MQISLLFLFLSLCGRHSLVAARSLIVPSSQYPSFSDAVVAASPNDTIVVGEGIFGCEATAIIATSPLRIVGAGASKTIFDCQGSGRAMQIVGSDLDMELKGLQVRGGTAENGGGIILAGSNITNLRMKIVDCLFFNNTAISANQSSVMGGAIFISGIVGNLDIDFANSLFLSNNVLPSTATQNAVGGGVAILFPQNLRNNSIRVTGGIFVDNLAEYGGGMHWTYSGQVIDSSVDIRGGSFQNNAATAQGGGLFVVFNSKVDSSCVKISNVIFNANVAEGSTGGAEGGGGGFWLNFKAESTRTSIDFKNSNFTNNSAPAGVDGGGGAVSVLFFSLASSTSINVNNTNFVGNSAPEGYGGGFFFYCNALASSVSISFIGGSFISNVGEASGGGVTLFFMTSSNTTTNFDGVDFIGNSASNPGGGGMCILFNYPASNASISLNNCNFVNNSVSQGGGGGALITFYALTSNTNISISNTNFISNSVYGQSGGGGGAFITFEKQNVSCTTISFLRTVFNSNSASQSDGGGGLSIYFDWTTTNTTISFDSASFFNNAAPFEYGATGGGAIFMDFSQASNTLINYKNTNLVGNSVTGGYGGGICVFFTWPTTTTQINFEGGNLINNIAPGGNGGGGGGFFVYFTTQTTDTSISFIGTNFATNSVSGGSGGAVYVIFGTKTLGTTSIDIVGGTYTDNLAYSVGGAVAVIVSSTFSLAFNVQSAVFRRNKVTHGGGGGLALSIPVGQQIQVAIANTSFESNQVMGGSGGGLSIVLPSDKPNPNCSLCPQCVPYGAGIGYGACTCNSPFSPLVGVFFCPPPSCGYINNGSICIFSLSNVYVTSQFVPLVFYSSVSITNATLSQNAASCPSCSAGGLYVKNGQLTLRDVSLIGNSAGQTAAAAWIDGTASIDLQDRIVIEDNAASSSGSSITATSQGSVKMRNANVVVSSPIPISSGEKLTAVSFSGVGKFEMSNSSTMNINCPVGYAAEDASLGSVPTLVTGFELPMSETDRTVNCIPCSTGFYSLESGSVEWIGTAGEAVASTTTTRDIHCLPCPFGGICSSPSSSSLLLLSDGGVLASEGFWGATFLSPSDALRMWSFTRCPLRYCCTNGKRGCVPTANLLNSNLTSTGVEVSLAACAMGRNSSVSLCGACLEGYSQNLRGAGCSPPGECNDGKWWVWLIAALVSVFFAGLLLVGSAPSDDIDKTRSSRKNEERIDVSWIVPTILYFVQNVTLIFEAVGSEQQSVVSILTSVCNLHLGSSSSSSSQSWSNVCVIEGLQTEEAIGLQLLFPLSIGMGLVIVWGVLKIGSLVPMMEERHHRRIHAWLSRFGIAALKLLLLFYTSIASVTGKLLHCVAVNGTEGLRVVFVAGGVECYREWQYALWIVFAVIVVPFPFSLTAVQVWMRRRRGFDDKEAVVTQSLMAIERPYGERKWYWPGVVLLRRLLIALVFSFGEDPFVQTVWMSLLFALFLIAHVVARPFRSWNGNVVEAVGLAMLLCTSIYSFKLAVYQDGGMTEISSGTIQSINDDFQFKSQVLFFLPFATAAVVMGWSLIAGWRRWIPLQTVVKKLLEWGTEMMGIENKKESLNGLELSLMEGEEKF